ncbi:MAG: ATP-dependent DNA ligase, partial [Betaproteobacteria bacterium]
MLLAELLAASERVAATRSRLAKIDALAQCLRRLEPSEIALGVAYLSGDTRQGRIGIGYATLKEARAAKRASSPRLTLAQVDEALASISQIKGEGSAAERQRLLAELFARATAPEQDFLARLLLGELRQGALEGFMLDAIAKAANLPPGRVRAAAMRAGGLAAV